jgi:PAS domain-containing protein
MTPKRSIPPFAPPTPVRRPVAPAAEPSPTALAGALLERLPEPVLLLGTTGRVLAANRAAASLLGMSNAGGGGCGSAA